MKFRMLHTIAAATFTAAATVGALQAAEEQTATEPTQPAQPAQPTTPTYGYAVPYAPYGVYPFGTPYAYAPVYGYDFRYTYGPTYGYGPWGVNEGWFQAQEKALLAQDEAIQEAMDQQMQAERKWMGQDRLTRQFPGDNYRRWRKAESDAWHRWVDPYGAWMDDMDDWRKAQRDAWVNARLRRHQALYGVTRPRLPLSDQQVAQEQTAAEPAATEPATTESTTETK